MGTKTCIPLAPLVFTAPDKPAVSQGLPHQVRHRHHLGEVVVRRIQVQHQVRGPVDVAGQPQRGVVLDRALVGQPQQRAPVIAQRVAHLALGRLGPHR